MPSVWYAIGMYKSLKVYKLMVAGLKYIKGKLAYVVRVPIILDRIQQ